MLTIIVVVAVLVGAGFWLSPRLAGFGTLGVLGIILAVVVLVPGPVGIGIYFLALQMHDEANKKAVDNLDYRLPPGTPPEIALTYDLTVYIETPEGKGGGTVHQTLKRVPGNRGSRGLGEGWRLDSGDFFVSIGHREFRSRSDDAYVRTIATACLGEEKNYADYAALATAVKALNRPCSVTIGRDLIRMMPPGGFFPTLSPPADPMMFIDSVRITELSVVPMPH